jgi:hypothetical protein
VSLIHTQHISLLLNVQDDSSAWGNQLQVGWLLIGGSSEWSRAWRKLSLSCRYWPCVPHNVQKLPLHKYVLDTFMEAVGRGKIKNSNLRAVTVENRFLQISFPEVMMQVDFEVRQRDVIFSMVHNIYKTRATSSLSINNSLYFPSSNFPSIFSSTSKSSTLSDHHPLLHVQLVNRHRHLVAHEVVILL